ncbi:hypothetical protein, partial [Klebsiella pneumoniae]|uniref:hypothetical protein n=1 Tax=Klebsiella pneumoniae TaxID=573 RepID=UPI0013D1B412
GDDQADLGISPCQPQGFVLVRSRVDLDAPSLEQLSHAPAQDIVILHKKNRNADEFASDGLADFGVPAFA